MIIILGSKDREMKPMSDAVGRLNRSAKDNANEFNSLLGDAVNLYYSRITLNKGLYMYISRSFVS